MGRSLTIAPVAAATTISTVPSIGFYSDVAIDGINYLPVGSVVSRVAYPSLASAFQVYGAYSRYTSTLLGTSMYINDIAFGAGVYIGVGMTTASAATTVIAISTDGINWVFSSTIPSGSYRRIIFAGNQFVAVGGSICATSPDGLVWTARTIAALVFTDIAYSGSVYVVTPGGDTGTSVYTSPDGITWTQRTVPSGYWQCVTYGGGLFAIGSRANGDTLGATSPDGITWTQRTLPSGGGWQSMAYGNGMFVAISGNATSTTVAASSPDGITWTQRTLPIFAYWRKVLFVNNVFFAISTVGVAYSTDGIKWYQKGATFSEACSGAVGVNGLILSCTGGANAMVNYFYDYGSPTGYILIGGTAGKFVRVL